MIRLRQKQILPALASLAMAVCQCAASDYWPSANDVGVQSDQYCGKVIAVAGAAAIRRSFMSDKDQPIALSAHDRLYADDEILVDGNSTMEWVFGSNVLCRAGPGSKFKCMGQSRFIGETGNRMSRLDVSLFEGQFRFQARLNVERPESVSAHLRDAEFLLTRGDFVLYADVNWRAVPIAGSVLYRTARGGSETLPVELAPGQAVATGGVEEVQAETVRAIRNSFPFSFEEYRNALPPLPSPDPDSEAP